MIYLPYLMLPPGLTDTQLECFELGIERRGGTSEVGWWGSRKNKEKEDHLFSSEKSKEHVVFIGFSKQR